MNLIRAPKPSQPNISAQSVRYLNELRALDVLFREGGMSRAELARILGLNRSTTGSIIGNLLTDELVIEQANRSVPNIRSGRPGIEIELNPSGAMFIGAAIVSDHLTALIIDLSGEILRKKSAPFHAARHTPDMAIEALAKLINALIAAESNPNRIYGICVAVPAMFEDGVLLEARLLGWRDVDIRPMIASHLTLDLPITVENDANAFAIAETYNGPELPETTVVFMLVDSGAGGGIVNGRRLLRGGFGLAGEFGHIRLADEGYTKGRGEPGQLETLIGKEATLARYAEKGGPAGAKLTDFLTALEAQDAAAVEVAQEWADWLARGLMTIINVLDPSLIIIGGPVGTIYRHVAPRVEDWLKTRLPPRFPMAKIQMSRFGPEGPAYGGALLLHQRAFSIDERALYPDGGARSLFRGIAV